MSRLWSRGSYRQSHIRLEIVGVGFDELSRFDDGGGVNGVYAYLFLICVVWVCFSCL